MREIHGYNHHLSAKLFVIFSDWAYNSTEG